MGFGKIIEYRAPVIDEVRNAGDGREQFGDPPTFLDLNVVEDRR